MKFEFVKRRITFQLYGRGNLKGGGIIFKAVREPTMEATMPTFVKRDTYPNFIFALFF